MSKAQPKHVACSSCSCTFVLNVGAAAQSLTELPLVERHKFLRAATKPRGQGEGMVLGKDSGLKGRVIVMLPGVVMPSGRVGSHVCTTSKEAEQLAQIATDNQASFPCIAAVAMLPGMQMPSRRVGSRICTVSAEAQQLAQIAPDTQASFALAC